MSSSQFLETLRLIGCPDVDRLTTESLDWMFEDESTQKFLSWICSCVTDENVLSTHDQNKYKLLKGQVLEGDDLEKALASLPDQETRTGEQLKNDVEQMKASIEKSKAKKSSLLKRCNKLGVHQMDLKNRVQKMQEVEAFWIKQKQNAEELCRTESSQMEVVLDSLSESVQQLMALYTSAQTDRSVDSGGTFLSQLELKAFHDAEAKFSKELTSFTKKQFFVGMADMAGEREETKYNLLDISSSESGLYAQENQDDAFLDDCKEFTRLQQTFPSSECARINALINAKKASSAVHEARSILHQLKSNVFPKGPNDISHLHQTAHQAAASAKAEWSPLLSSVPDLIQELGDLQGTEILTGDYDLKLKRQDYFGKSQDKIIADLIAQRARSEFLSMLYDLELKWHRETHGLLSAARQTMESQMLDWQSRMSELSEPDLSEKRFDRSVVDTRDTATARLHQLMDDAKEGEKQLYLATEKVLDKAKELRADLSEAQASDKARDESDLFKVDQLRSCVRDCESVLYAGSSTHAGNPNMTSTQVKCAMTQVASQLNQLERKVLDVVAQVNSKKNDLRSNILQKKERELFVLFHTNPEKLKYVVNGLAERGKTRQIKET